MSRTTPVGVAVDDDGHGGAHHVLLHVQLAELHDRRERARGVGGRGGRLRLLLADEVGASVDAGRRLLLGRLRRGLGRTAARGLRARA